MVNVLVENYFTDADPAMLLSELGLFQAEAVSSLWMVKAGQITAAISLLQASPVG